MAITVKPQYMGVHGHYGDPCPIPPFEIQILRTKAHPGRTSVFLQRFRPPLGVSLAFPPLVNLLVTADAQTLQVTLFMSAAFCQGLDVMH